ncbi:hypothetical protein C0991_000273, partial [Blastosporella zonata]
VSSQSGETDKGTQSVGTCLQAAYNINPVFVHVDKDMAEISMAKEVWSSAKISLCWWHLRRAVRTRLANGKLATSTYNVHRVHAEFDSINVSFGPVGCTDDGDYEGELPDDAPSTTPASAPLASDPTLNMHKANPSNKW